MRSCGSLACGDGSNLLSIAESLPAASCLGIDLAARHIATAQPHHARQPSWLRDIAEGVVRAVGFQL